VAMRQRRVHRDAAAAVRLTEAGSLVQGSDDAVERCTAPLLRVQAGGSIHATSGCNLFRSPYLRSILLKCNGDSIVNRHIWSFRQQLERPQSSQSLSEPIKRRKVPLG